MYADQHPDRYWMIRPRVVIDDYKAKGKDWSQNVGKNETTARTIHSAFTDPVAFDARWYLSDGYHERKVCPYYIPYLENGV